MFLAEKCWGEKHSGDSGVGEGNYKVYFATMNAKNIVPLKRID